MTAKPVLTASMEIPDLFLILAYWVVLEDFALNLTVVWTKILGQANFSVDGGPHKS